MSAGVSLALGLAADVAVAQAPPQVIASNARPAAPAAVLGAPVARPGFQPAIAPVAFTARAQKDDKPAGPPLVSSDSGPFTPLHPPAPAVGNPLPPPVPINPSVPCTNCIGGNFDPTLAPLPGGVFANPPSFDNNRWFVSAEYLYWWIRDSGVPILVTTGPATDPVPGLLNPVLGPGTEVLFGNDSLDTQGRSGARFEFGRWFGVARPWALEGGFFFLGQRSVNYTASGDGSPGTQIIGRPFFEVNRGIENIEYVTAPGIAGDISITGTTNFYGAHADWRRRLWCGPCFRLDGQLGVRFLNLEEDLYIAEQNTIVGATRFTSGANGLVAPLGTTSTVIDSFKVDNDFYGVMLGLVGEWRKGMWSLQLRGSVSLGETRQRIEIAGGQTVSVPGASTGNFPGGLLARPSNIGEYSNNEFTAVPEVGFNVGCQLTPRLKLFAGYSFLYWGNVARVGDQIDRSVNVAGIPFFPQPPAIPAGTARPMPLLQDTDFWAQGVNVGLEWKW